VIARQQFFEVICYEGKVKVLSNNNNYILEKGDAIRIDDQQKSTWKDAGAQQPSWITGESSFKNMPFVDVVVQLENQYRYTVQFPKTLLDKKISGTFPHDDINAALKAICLPLGLQFKITGNRTIIISE
jgi:ferric-dicitrate binding protein FerR (iron transport regulator)